jgi:hypothetical protein
MEEGDNVTKATPLASSLSHINDVSEDFDDEGTPFIQGKPLQTK